MKGDLSPFKRAQARDISEFLHSPNHLPPPLLPSAPPLPTVAGCATIPAGPVNDTGREGVPRRES